MEELINLYRLHLTETHRTGTVRKKTKALELFISWCWAQEINPGQIHYDQLLKYIEHCRKRNLVHRTIENYLVTIRDFYGLLHLEGKRSDNPALELKLVGGINKHPQAGLSKEELDTMYKNYPSHGLKNRRDRVMAGLLIYQGITPDELLQIETKDIRLSEGTVYIPAVKRSCSRILQLEALQALHLQNYLVAVRKALEIKHKTVSHKLFIGIARALPGISKELKKIQPKIKSLYQIRGSVLSNWLKSHHVRQVQYMAGHRRVSSTARYRIDHLESLQEQLEKLHPLK